ncbi:MAG: cadherin-like domain-containing protein, partial [Gammaproteobacteria bacterium]|nr:cadherin-like domain-containing protein [Gammaproteobacteria bacterium]
MQYFTRGIFRGACYSGLLFLGLGLTACSTSEDLDENTANISPLAVDDASTVDKGATARIDVAANDSDADDGLDLASISIVSRPASGTTVVNADGSVDYSHDGSNTTTDTFTYTIKDNSAAVSNTATVSITINAPVNIPPTAANDAFTVNKGSTTTLNVSANDDDADDGLDFASISIVAMPANGTVAVNSDGTVNYTHDNSNTAADTFSYTIKDNSAALSNVATVTITVSAAPVNVPPTAADDAYT